MSFVIRQTNPKRPDSKSHERYERYKSATNLAEMLALGGTRADYNHDLKKGFITLAGGAAPAASSGGAKRPAPAASSGAPRMKKVRDAPKRPGFVLFRKVDTRVVRWDKKTFEGKSPEEAAHARDENETAARKHDGSAIVHTTVHGDLEAPRPASAPFFLLSLPLSLPPARARATRRRRRAPTPPRSRSAAPSSTATRATTCRTTPSSGPPRT